MTSLAFGKTDKASNSSGANRYLQCLARSNHFTSVVMTAMAADMMRALQLAAVAAFSMCFRAKSLMAATHATA
jgi:hypothetical protein